MLTSFFKPSEATGFGRRQQGRRHPGALILAIILHILAFLILLWQRSEPVPVKQQHELVGFSLMPDAKQDAGGEKTQTKSKKDAAAKGSSPNAPAAVTPPLPKPREDTPAVPSANPLPFMEMSSQDFASSNIGGIPSGRTGTQASGDSKAPYGPGSGPGGTTLYKADWYPRPPSDAELNGYLPANAPRNGWGEIACKTIEHYHVEDCISMGESPLGSGFARSLRQAAWQFLVMPPRVNGKPMIGAWVRIHIDYRTYNVAAPGGDGTDSGGGG